MYAYLRKLIVLKIWPFLSFQLCVNIQIPKSLRGLGAAAIYIDMHRGFPIDRIKGNVKILNITQCVINTHPYFIFRGDFKCIY